MFFFTPVFSKLGSSALLSHLDVAPANQSEMGVFGGASFVGRDTVGVTCLFVREQAREENEKSFLPNVVRDLLSSHFNVEQVVSAAGRTESKAPLSPTSYAVRYALTAEDVCGLLRDSGESALADRIAYFASDEDLSEGDIPVTAESARGFLSFWGKVRSDGRISLTCSQEGWICAEWTFTDRRGASLWFLNDEQIMFAASDVSGNFVEVVRGSEIASCDVVAAKLVEAGLFAWSLNRLANTSSYPVITFSDIADRVTSTPSVSPRPTPSAFATENFTYQPVGWNTSTTQTAQSKFRELVEI